MEETGEVVSQSRTLIIKYAWALKRAGWPYSVARLETIQASREAMKQPIEVQALREHCAKRLLNQIKEGPRANTQRRCN